MNIRIIALLIGSLLINGTFFVCASRQPVKRDGRYYFDENDRHEHINLTKALSFIIQKSIDFELWKKLIVAFFRSTPKQAQDPVIYHQTLPPQYAIEPQLTWIGHASFLIQKNNFNILTDPVFGNMKAGPLTISKRSMPPGVKIEDLPPIDAIVISHNHTDHTDTETLMAICKKHNPVVLVPEGDRALFESMGFSKVIEKNWGQSHQLIKDNQTITFTFLPAYHWSIRFSLGSYRKSLWGSWMISTPDNNIYFAGDSAHGPHFKEIGQQFSSINYALLPVSNKDNKCDANHKACHLDTNEAIDAFIDLGAHHFVPMHYGTFWGKNTKETTDHLQTYWSSQKERLHNKQLLIAECGKTYNLDK